MHYRIEIIPLTQDLDITGKKVAKKISTILGIAIQRVATRTVYSLYSDILEPDARKFGEEIVNSVTEKVNLGEVSDNQWTWAIVIGFLPGVTDNVSNTALVALGDILGKDAQDVTRIYSSMEYLFYGTDLDRPKVESIATGLLANPLINSILCLPRDECTSKGFPVNQPEYIISTETNVEKINLDTDDDCLRSLSADRQWALSLGEMKAIRDYLMRIGDTAGRQSVGLDKRATDVELEVLAQTWSEHCKHKIFDAVIEYVDENGNKEIIDSLYKTYIKKSTFEIADTVDWLLSVFKDNAGVIAFNDDLDLVYKVETHNSPSALDPYGGAMTGIVGVNRDPLGTGMGANLLLNVWGYCFGSPFTASEEVPAGLLHPERIRDGVHQGVIEGGNQSGIPYALGWEYFDERFIGKPLVFCGTVGTLPKRINGSLGYEKDILPGDLIVMAGGRIGKDGIHGATFSSEVLTQESPSQAVQIGDPITQKMLSDFIIEARDLGLYRFITDNGAGGLSSSIGEISAVSNGCKLDLSNAPLKYPGLQPWEILLSESQERMSLAVPTDKIEEFSALAKSRDVEISVLGEFTDTGKFHVVYKEQTIAYLDLEFMHEGCPRMQLTAKWDCPQLNDPATTDTVPESNLEQLILNLLARLNICSNEFKARQYDHEVKALSIIKPFVGVACDVVSDATVNMIAPLSKEGIVLAHGVLPRYSDIDTYHMAASVIDLAVRRIIAVGGSLDRIAAIDNFCWPDPVKAAGNPDGEYKLAQLVRANKALYDFTKLYNVPCISGKDSMKNDSTKGGVKISVPPTLLFSTVGKMNDVSLAVTLDAKKVGDLVYIIGTTGREMGGSEYHAMCDLTSGAVPGVDAISAIRTYKALSSATTEELCHSIHTPAIGGLAAGFAKVAIAGRLGLRINVDAIPVSETLNLIELLFSESNSRFIVTIPPRNQSRFETVMADTKIACVGEVVGDEKLMFVRNRDLVVSLQISDMIKSYKTTLDSR